MNTRPKAMLIDITRCIGCRSCEWLAGQWRRHLFPQVAEFAISLVVITAAVVAFRYAALHLEIFPKTAPAAASFTARREVALRALRVAA